MRKKSEVLKTRESIPGGCCERFAEYKDCNCLAEAEPDCTLVEAFQKLAEAAGGRWDGVDAEKYVRELRGDLPKETFPRGPSNEQTLLTELGEVKRALEKSAWDERELEGSLAMARQHIALLQKERDALAVAAEGLKKAYRLQRKGMESMAELQDGLKQEVRNQAEQIKQLKCKADLFDNFTAAVVALEPHAGKPEASVEALLDKIGELKIVEAERDALKAKLAEVQEDLEDEQDSGDSAYAADTKRIYEIRELTAERDAIAVTAERLREERDDWKARCEAAEAEAAQLSGLKIALRLRESLANCVDYLPAHLPVAQAARNILKETAP